MEGLEPFGAFANKSELMEGGTKPTLNTGDWKDHPV